jgi:hypothetical protein
LTVLEKFDQHLQYLGFNMAPLAWDLANIPWRSDIERIAFLDQITQNETDVYGEPGL